MKEYIELKAAVELAMQYCPDDDGACSKADRDIRELLDELENLPSIQLDMPLVRCKDCKHVRKWRSEESAKKFGQVYECARGILTCPNPNDFCSYGERSERKNHDIW